MIEQLSLLELLERPSLEALLKPDQIFESDDPSFVISHPENTRFDRKSARIAPKGLAYCLSAFGNGPAVEGGVVAIGGSKKMAASLDAKVSRPITCRNWKRWEEIIVRLANLGHGVSPLRIVKGRTISLF